MALFFRNCNVLEVPFKARASLKSQLSCHSQRRFLHKAAVDLSYTSIIPQNGNAHQNPLIILHGLFGSKRIWGSFLKEVHTDMPNRAIYALDLRNHGSSPHATPMTYEAMAEDVNKFVEDRNLKDVTLLGHSMGGKVAMAYALARPERLSHLIVADIAPSTGTLSPEFVQYISLMQEIESLPSGKITKRSDADKILAARGIDMSVRQFLLTNLHIPAKPDDKKIRFTVPLHIVSQSVPDLGSFPYGYDADNSSVPVHVSWTGPTLAIRGTRSTYINHSNIPIMRAFFPNVCISELDTEHWVHAEKPLEFRKLVVEFLTKNSGPT